MIDADSFLSLLDSPCTPHTVNRMKRQKDMTLKDELPSSTDPNMLLEKSA